MRGLQFEHLGITSAVIDQLVVRSLPWRLVPAPHLQGDLHHLFQPLEPFGQRRERLPGTPDREVTSLTELPALVGIPARS